jgi:catechol 2,3-dioxygenase
VHSVDEFVIGVPDLAEAKRFYDSFGLDVRHEGATLGLYTVGHPHRWGRVVGGVARKKLLWLSLGAFPDDLPALRQQLERVGAREVAPCEPSDPEALWFSSPDGVPMQVRAAAKCSPSEPAPRSPAPDAVSGKGTGGRCLPRSRSGKVHPLYLSHVLLFTGDVDRTLAFLVDGMGLRLSDRSGSVIAFLHTPHGSDHHLVALAKSSGPGLHHSSWCVPSIDAVGLGMAQMTAQGYSEGWGVGRHVLGSNYFRYVKDPWGSYVEYSFDIDYVGAGTVWPAGDHPAEDSLYAWGPCVPEDFVVNMEVEGLEGGQ